MFSSHVVMFLFPFHEAIEAIQTLYPFLFQAPGTDAASAEL